MALIEAFIHNPVKVSVGVLLVVLFGVIELARMPVELTPQVERPTLSIRAGWPGAAPEDIEREIVLKLEDLLNDIPGMTEMTSDSRESRGYIRMEFSVGTDMSEVLVQISSRLQQIRDYPQDADDPVVYTSSTTSSSVARFNLVARPPDPQQIAEYQQRFPELAESLERVRTAHSPILAREWLAELVQEHAVLAPLLPPDIPVHELGLFARQYVADAFTRVPGVADVQIWGGQIPEMQVVIDPYELAARELTIPGVRQVLRNENRDTPGGDLQEGDDHFAVRTIGRYDSPEQVANEILGVQNGVPIRVRDVADVRLGYKRGRESSRQFRSRSLTMPITKTPGANIFDVVDGVKAVAEELNEGILKQTGVYLAQSEDSTIYVESSLSLVKKNIFLGGMLTFVVLLLFLRNARSTLIVALAIPVSIIGTFLMLGILGRTLNVISLAGMAFAVGMLVDNAVVVLENIFRHHQQGEPPITAALRGTKEVWGATVASTLTTLAVFIPILFVREEAGQLFRDIALAISCGVGLSLIVSVTLIPTAACRLLQAPDPSRGGGGSSRWMALADSIGAWTVNRLAQANAFLLQSVSRRLAVVVIFLSGSLLLIYVMMPPIEYLPSGKRNRIYGSMTPPPGYSVEKMMRLATQFHDRMRPLAEVQPGSPEAEQLEYPIVSDLIYGAYSGFIWVGASTLDPARASELVPLMREIGDEISAENPGVQVSINQSGLFQGGWNRAGRSIQIDVRGPELDQLVKFGTRIRDQVLEQIPDAHVNVRPSLTLNAPKLHIVPRKFRAAEMGISSSDLGYSVSAFVDGAYATNYFHNGDEIDMTIVGGDDVSVKQDDLPIAIPNGQVVPLSALADVSVGTGVPQISHIERVRALSITVSPPDEMALGEAIALIENEVIDPLKASGELGGLYQATMSGTADKLRATWEALRFNFVLVLLITYLLMAALFESWLYPLVIMVSVPLATVGGLAGLRLMNLFVIQQLDILTMLGFIILVGTVVNNAILIVHQSLNHMRYDQLRPDEAIISSVRNRVRPIFMTTFTTSVGLLPLVLFPGAGSELYRGLGSVMLGGLVVSTIFTLFLVPSLFSLTLQSREALAKLLLPAKTPDLATAPTTLSAEPVLSSIKNVSAPSINPDA